MRMQVRGADASHAAPNALHACASWAAERVLGMMRRLNLSEAYLATDLRGGASGTYAVGAAQVSPYVPARTCSFLLGVAIGSVRVVRLSCLTSPRLMPP